MINKINFVIEEDIFSKDFIIKEFSKKFYGYLKSTKSTFYVNNKIVDLDVLLKKDDLYEINYFNKEKNTIKVNKEIDILYEDEYLIIVDKPYNLLTIPSRYEIDSIYSRLIFHRENDSMNILTRLDKETKGVVVVSKKHYLVDKIKIIEKNYITKTSNYLPKDFGIIELPIKKTDTIKRVVDENGQKAITKYELIDKKNYIYKISLLTGRTHQIRVHLNHFNCSIVGDNIYGGAGELMLICKEIKLIHPISKEIIIVKSKFELR